MSQTILCGAMVLLSINQNTLKRKKTEKLLMNNKAKFLAFSFFVSSEAEVKKYIAAIKAEYSDARHFVWAYRLTEVGISKEKYTEDKEPAGSAGSAILFLLKKKEVNNCLIVVVRYFGGVKLGVGGLARAYTASTNIVLERKD